MFPLHLQPIEDHFFFTQFFRVFVRVTHTSSPPLSFIASSTVWPAPSLSQGDDGEIGPRGLPGEPVSGSMPFYSVWPHRWCDGGDSSGVVLALFDNMDRTSQSYRVRRLPWFYHSVCLSGWRWKKPAAGITAVGLASHPLSFHKKDPDITCYDSFSPPGCATLVRTFSTNWWVK